MIQYKFKVEDDAVNLSYHQVQRQKQQYDNEEKGTDYQCLTISNQNNI